MISKNDITIIIPFLRSNPDRFLNLKYLLDCLTKDNFNIILVEQRYSQFSIEGYIKKFYPSVKYIESNENLSLINKSRLVNIGVANSSTKYIWQLDADVILPFNQILSLLPDDVDVAKPFDMIIKLNKEETNKKRDNEKINIKSGSLRETVNKFGPLSYIIKKEIYVKENGMDERFEGWGWEDIAFANKIKDKYEVFECLNIYGSHLCHPPAVSNEILNERLLANEAEPENNRKIKRVVKYNKDKYQDIGIIITFFSPCNFKKPRENLLTILQKILDSNYKVCVVEAVMPESDPLILPKNINLKHIQIKANKENIAFQKESLFNIGAQQTDYKKLIFLDADVEFDDPDWLNCSSLLLNTYDIIQPYDVAIWLDENNTNKQILRISAAKAIKDKIPIHGAKQHPGFAWGMTRKTFDRLKQGFYYQHPLGGSDTIFWFSLIQNDMEEGIISHWVVTNEFFKNTESFQKYREYTKKQNFTVGYIENCTILHLYHGNIKNRQYVSRNFDYMPDMKNKDFPVYRSKNGLLAWKNLDDAEKCLSYFKSRMEDD